MELEAIPYDSSLMKYEAQAQELLNAFRLGDSGAIRVLHHNHPRFLDDKIRWLPKRLPEAEIRTAPLELADARLALARWYSFEGWAALENYVAAVTQQGSEVFQFESAVEAIIAGELSALQRLLAGNPELIRARSKRITHFDPPVHRATLLHYIAANGVEGYRQKTPPNAVEVARTLLTAGAEADALADMYGGHYTTMSLLVSSCHPAKAGVQVALVETLADFGAAVEPRGSAKWGSPLMTALAFGYRDAAEALVRRGATVDSLAAAAGLGRREDVRRLLATSDELDRHRALALAAQHGHVDIVGLLLDAGEDPNRYNPDGNHSHSTPLHQSILAGHTEVARLLVERGARLDMADTIYQGTALDWAIYGGQKEIGDWLRQQGARTAEELAS